jgi:anti-sigma-K factor RskA
MRRRVRDPEPVELAALADGSLAPDRRDPLEARVAESSELADRLAEQQYAVALARSVAGEVEAPVRLRARIEEQTRAARAPERRRLALFGAAAAALAAAALAVALVVMSSTSSAERFRTALSATALAPGAGGNATLTKTSSGWRIELRATGLARRTGRRFYEAWLRNPAGVLVPIGTFNDGRKVTLWAGVSPTEFTTLTITREQADGDQASSGEKVLVGTISGSS